MVADSEGNPISSGTLVVDVTFPSPMDIYNYSYEVSLSGSYSQVGFYVAPDGDEALMTMRVRDGSGALSDELVVSNSVYWEKVSESTDGIRCRTHVRDWCRGEDDSGGGSGHHLWRSARLDLAGGGAGGDRRGGGRIPPVPSESQARLDSSGFGLLRESFCA